MTRGLRSKQTAKQTIQQTAVALGHNDSSYHPANAAASTPAEPHGHHQQDDPQDKNQNDSEHDKKVKEAVTQLKKTDDRKQERLDRQQRMKDEREQLKDTPLFQLSKWLNLSECHIQICKTEITALGASSCPMTEGIAREYSANVKKNQTTLT